MAALSSVVFFQSCGDDDGPKDITVPEITISGITEGDEVWNTINLEASATDDIAVAKIELYVDNELITSDETSASINKTWDTNDVEDGAHTIKAVATDEAGNRAEHAINFIIKNTLLSISTPSDLFSDEITGIVFISDTDGNLITQANIENNIAIILRSKDFTGQALNITEAFKKDDQWILNTFTGLKRGDDWTLSSPTFQEASDENTRAYITFKNFPDNEETSCEISTENSYYIDTFSNLKIQSPISYQSNKPGFYCVKKVGNAYYGELFGSFENSIEIDNSNFTTPLSIKTIDFPTDQRWEVELLGLKDGSEYLLSEGETSNSNNSIALHYSESAFDNYLTLLSFHATNNITINQYNYGLNETNFSPQTVNYDFSINRKKIN
ncbi:Ig-like domain-containing protein [Fulvivirga ligni]|uniref:Ig-like domain-containing protein n=1 Tax=Fulvivirga ligni TaxID=2904246 RepID=UPI001F1FC8C6|nr:Ig-like domain-containing protein [Fulvivirga ligni]UII19141.1 Ig-like domain-containing protein [Fulvivirga ligni]